MHGPQLAALLYSVLNLRIPQHLSSGPKTIDEICPEGGVCRDKLERVLLALESEGIFNYKQDTKQFSLNDISNVFLNDQLSN